MNYKIVNNVRTKTVVNYDDNLYKMYTLDILPYNLQVSYVGMSLGAINVLTESSD